jgi:hypothetical protein
MLITIPLIDEDGNPRGYLSQSIKYSKWQFIPRIGESVFIGPGMSPKVVNVFYDGPTYQSIRIELEPIAEYWKKFLIQQPLNKRGPRDWKWFEGDDVKGS